MKKTAKTLLSLTTAALMAASSFVTAFAAESPEDTNRLKLFGQELVQFHDSKSGKEYLAIIDGTDTVNGNDFTPVDSSKTAKDILGEWRYNTEFKANEYSADLIHGYFNYDWNAINSMDITYTRYVYGYNEAEGYDYDSVIYIAKLPSGLTAADMGELSKYVIYANGTEAQSQQATDTTAQPTDKGYGDWASDNKGWWIQYADGTYLTNDWWKSPTSGLWYYMGADGYMVTNTVIDGYTINADGVWVQ